MRSSLIFAGLYQTVMQRCSDMEDHYAFERSYWGDCCNTFDEERKQFTYAKYMGLKEAGPYAFDVEGKSVLDIGGGPVSLLLKCKNLHHGLVVDPIAYPQWTIDRYKAKNIRVLQARGEELTYSESLFDEVWIYNCLQHVDDIEKLLRNALSRASLLRFFEWVDIPPHEGHPQMLTSGLLEELLRDTVGSGFYSLDATTPVFNDPHGCYGKAYAGVMKY